MSITTLEIMKQDIEKKIAQAQETMAENAEQLQDDNENLQTPPYTESIDPSTLDEGQISEVIGMAWCDKTSFDAIALQTGLSEPQVINIMRTHMKRSSFKMWRKRVTGRKAKHSSLL